MNAQFILEEEPLTNAKEKPGKRLRIARQAKGLDQDKIADQLHLNRAAVQAIEHDNYDALPGPVFTRGYIRNYARLLNLDPEPLLDAFAALQPLEAEPTPRVQAAPRKPSKSRRLIARLVIWTVLIGLVALLGLWWQTRLEWDRIPLLDDASTEIDDVGTEQPTSEAPAPVADQTTELAQYPFESELPVSVPSTANVDAQPTPTIQEDLTSELPSEVAASDEPAETIAVEESAVETEDVETVPSDGVVVEFTGPCWVDIRDSSRKFKLFGEMQKGDSHVLGGTPPYSVILGNSPMVKIKVNGKDFDVAARSRGNVARFTLNLDSAN